MTKDCYMASLDLKNAYHTVPIDSSHTKFLKFQFKDKTYEFLTLPQGYRDSPRIFTKILKPVLAFLRSKGLLSSVYIDDFFLLGLTFEECQFNVHTTKTLLLSLGFDLSDKSVMTPVNILPHLGFLLDSSTMRVSLEVSKREQVLLVCQKTLLNRRLSIRGLAKLIGTLVACFPAVEYGALFYRELELLKIISLSRNNYNFKSQVVLTSKAKDEILWWMREGLFSGKAISHGNPDFVLKSDSSGYGWGATMNGRQTQGLWSHIEADLNINVKELKAAMLGLFSLAKDVKSCHIQIQLDNVTAVSYINHMGGTHSVLCNELTKELILWCKTRDIWLSAAHIAGKDNVEADALSRKIKSNTEWMLNASQFDSLCELYGKPHIDLFANRSNHRLPLYMSRLPDPNAIAIDAFLHPWLDYVYIFCPFIMIPRVLKKLLEDKTKKALVIAPYWPVAAWFPRILQMCIAPPLHLTMSKTLLQLPSDMKAVHPLYPKLKMAAFLLSGSYINNGD